MNYRRLGRTGWSVSEIGYGMWGMGNWKGTEDELTFDVLQRAVDLGCNFFDTALAYGEGRSEALLGRIVRANPKKRIYTSTKVPPLNRQWPGISINRWEPWNGVRTVRSGLVDVVQVIYNIFDQNPEDELFPACVEHDVAIIARVPFDEGSLAGTLTKGSWWPEGDWRKGYFVPENLISSVEHAEALKPLVPANMTMPEMALRFILSNSHVSTVIPGMRKSRYVEANVAASDAGPLPEDLLRKLRAHRWERQPTEWSQ